MFFTLGGGDANENAVRIARQASQKAARPRRHARPLVPRRELHGHGALGRCPHGAPGGFAKPGACATCRRLMPIAAPSAARPRRNAATRGAARVGEMHRHGRRGPRRRGADGSRTPAATASSPPDNYWPALRRVTRERDVYLIADEVMSGFGRCGEWFAWQRYGEDGRPDLMTLAKGLTGARRPARRRRHERGRSRASSSARCSTAASPIAATRSPAPPASRRIDAYRDEKLIERSRALGAQMFARTAEARRAPSGHRRRARRPRPVRRRRARRRPRDQGADRALARRRATP